MPAPDDRLPAELAAIRDRNEHLRTRYGYVGGLLALAGARDDVPRLLAALDAVLALHQPEPVKWTDVCTAHLSFTTTMAEEEECPACQVITYTACTRCRNADDEPARLEDCEVREAITRELTGEGSDGEKPRH